MISVWWLIPAAMLGALFDVFLAAIATGNKGDDDQ